MEDDVPSIIVPIRHSDKVVEIFIDEFPDDVENGGLLTLLAQEVAPLHIWHKFAVEYYRQGRVDAFRLILSEAREGFSYFEAEISKDDVQGKREFNESRLLTLNALCADLITTFIEERNKARADELNTQIVEMLSQVRPLLLHFLANSACKERPRKCPSSSFL